MTVEIAEARRAPQPPSPLERAILDWFVANISSSPVSRDVDALNHLRAALPDLARRLQPLMKE